MKKLPLVVMILALSACTLWKKPYRPPSSAKAKHSSTTPPSTVARPEERPFPDPEMVKRAHAVAEMEGHPDGKALLSATGCGNLAAECGRDYFRAEKEAPATFKAGRALAEKRPDWAEKIMSDAEALAVKLGTKRRANDEKRKADEEAVSADLKACADDKTPCRRRCDEDKTSSACVAMAVYLITGDRDDRYDQADALLVPPCNAGMQPACAARTKAAAERAKVFGPVDDAWSNVETAGDDLAQRKHMHAFASAHLRGPRNALAAQRLGQHIQALTTESYCPAVKEFLKVSNRAEFARRSKLHCAEDPPTGTGLSGEEVVLTKECNAVYAIPCP